MVIPRSRKWSGKSEMLPLGSDSSEPQQSSALVLCTLPPVNLTLHFTLIVKIQGNYFHWGNNCPLLAVPNQLNQSKRSHLYFDIYTIQYPLSSLFGSFSVFGVSISSKVCNWPYNFCNLFFSSHVSKQAFKNAPHRPQLAEVKPGSYNHLYVYPPAKEATPIAAET